jgi:hypothetical protein
MDNNKKNKGKKSFSIFVLWIMGSLFVIVLWIGSLLIFTYALPCIGWTEKGSIGDSFGAVNALFSGFAFLAFVITIYLQFTELRQSKIDRDIQSFEDKFFQLIRVYNDILDGIEKPQRVGGSTGAILIIKGRRRFVDLYNAFNKAYEAEVNKNQGDTPLVNIQRAHDDLFERNQHELGHYFRNLYHIVVFIHTSKFTYDIRKSYIKLLRAQLSSHELLLLFYNCLSTVGARKFKPLIERYALLEHMPKLVHDEHRNLYNIGAFVEVDIESQ